MSRCQRAVNIAAAVAVVHTAVMSQIARMTIRAVSLAATIDSMNIYD
jgi:hypothetical protein